MKDLEKFNKLAEEFKEKIANNNSKVSNINNITDVDKIHNLYNTIKNNISKIQNKSESISSDYLKFCDSYVQVICYMLYYNKISEFTENYNNLANMVNMFLGKDSEIDKKLSNIEKQLIIIKSESSTDEQIVNALNDLKVSLTDFSNHILSFAKKYGYSYDDPKLVNTHEKPVFTAKNENKKLYTIKNNSERSFITYKINEEHSTDVNNGIVSAVFSKNISSSNKITFTIKNVDLDKDLVLSYYLFKSDNTKSAIFTTTFKPNSSKTLSIDLNNCNILCIEGVDDSGAFEIYDIFFDNVDYPKKLKAKGKKYVVNTEYIPNSKFIIYSGYVDRHNMVAQKSNIFIKQPLNDSGLPTGVLNITSPVLNYFDKEFTHLPHNWWIMNIYDYVTYNINEAAENENKKAYQVDVDTVRFGNIFSPTDIVPTAGSQSVSFKFSDGDWIGGSINKGNKYKLQKITIIPKFKNSNNFEITQTYFSDSIEIIQYYTSFSIDGTIKNYIIKGELDYNKELTTKKNEEISIKNQLISTTKNEEGTDAEDTDSKPNESDILNAFLVKYEKSGSFYTGSFKMYDEYDNLLSSAQNGILGNLANKDIICKIVYNGSSVDVSCEIDTRNIQSTMFNGDELTSDLATLPTIAASFNYENLELTDEAVFASADEKIIENLLTIGSLDVNDFSESLYYSSLESFMQLKNMLLGELLGVLSVIDGTVNSCVLTNNLLSQYDSTYCSDYTSDILNNFNLLLSTIKEYSTGNATKPEELYNGVVYSKIIENLKKIKESFNKFIDDFFGAIDIYKVWNDKLKTIAPITKPDLTSTINTIYEILTLKLSSFANMASTNEYNFIKFDIMSYSEWCQWYDKIYETKQHKNDPNISKKYFIDNVNKALLYISTQIYTELLKYKPTDGVELIKSFSVRFIKTIIIDLMYSNLGKTYENKYVYDEVINEDLFEDIYLPFCKIKDKYLINKSNINADYINPYIYEVFPDLKQFNTYDLKNTEKPHPEVLKPLFYISILKMKSSDEINDSFKKLYDFLQNGQKLNFRELIVLVSMLMVYNDIKNSELSEYINSLDNIDIDNEYKKLNYNYNLLKNYYFEYFNNDTDLTHFLNKEYISKDGNILIYKNTQNIDASTDILDYVLSLDSTIEYKITLCDLLLNNIQIKYVNTEEDKTNE